MDSQDEFVLQTDSTRTAQVVSLLDPSDVERLGGLPNEAIMGQLVYPAATRRRWRRGAPQEGAPELKVNDRFVEFLHRVIARWAPREPGFAAEVERQQDGFIYVLDGRTPTPQRAVPKEDIIGKFEVRQGEVVPESYEPCPAHQLLNEHGLLQLSPFMYERFVLELKALPRES